LKTYSFSNILLKNVVTRDAEAVEAVKFLWKWKHFEERSWKQKLTRKHLTFSKALKIKNEILD